MHTHADSIIVDVGKLPDRLAVHLGAPFPLSSRLVQQSAKTNHEVVSQALELQASLGAVS